MTTSEICGRVNALLNARGESREFTGREIGWKLSTLELPRQRTAKAMVLKPSSVLRGRLHELTARFGLELQKIKSCQECMKQ
jgi:hypothetical protein